MFMIHKLIFLFSSITVKNFLNGKVVRKISIQRPERPEDAIDIIVEDPTFCEICHSDENEDRILLCDGRFFSTFYVEFYTNFFIINRM